MKKGIALFFCLQILSGNSFAAELMKLPFLIQHYFEHESEKKEGLSVTDFLWEHYVDDAHEKQGDCEEKLPFKHCHDCCSHVSFVVAFVLPDVAFTLPSHTNIEQPCCVHKAQFISFYSSCIWQPPKLG